MKAIMWKEFRENLKWAVALLLLTSADMGRVVWFHEFANPLNGGFLGVTEYVFAGGAFFIGLMQARSEARRDLWGFLLHRPVSPNVLFAGKVAVGLPLYLLAAGIPFLCAILWMATPGHFSCPFYWPTVLPGVADLLAGIAYYFAGLLVGLRQARWYASKVLPLSTAFLCSLFVVNLPEFWMALISIALAIALLALAAWGSFLAGGGSDPQPRKTKFALGFTLTVGILIVGGIALLIAGAMFPTRRLEYRYSQYVLDRHGQVLLETGNQSAILSITDPAGQPLNEYKNLPFPISHSRLNEQKIQFLTVGYLPTSQVIKRQLKGDYRMVDRFWNYVSNTDELMWIYSKVEQRLLAYHFSSWHMRQEQGHGLAGTLGPKGFVPAEQGRAKPFPYASIGKSTSEYNNDAYPGSHQSIFIFPDAVYENELKDFRLKPLLAAPPGDAILSATRLPKQHDDNTNDEGLIELTEDDDSEEALKRQDKERPVVVMTEQSIYFLGKDGMPLVAAKKEYDSIKYVNVELIKVPKQERYFIWYQPAWFFMLKEKERLPSYLLEYAPGGKLVNRLELPPLRDPVPLQPPHPSYSVIVLGAFMPVSLYVPLRLIQKRSHDADEYIGFQNRLFVQAFMNAEEEEAAEKEQYALSIAIAVCGLISAGLNWKRARAYAFSTRRRIGWSAAGFLLGPAGVLLLLCMTEWPARVKCAACGKKRVVSRELCEHCGKPFDPPEKDGTEILEAAAD